MAQERSVNASYAAAPKLLELSLRYLASLDLSTMALPELRLLKEQTGQTTRLSLHVGRGRVYLDQVETDSEVEQTITLAIGRPVTVNIWLSSRLRP